MSRSVLIGDGRGKDDDGGSVVKPADVAPKSFVEHPGVRSNVCASLLLRSNAEEVGAVTKEHGPEV